MLVQANYNILRVGIYAISELLELFLENY